jgi:phage terminase large subunit-like protein
MTNLAYRQEILAEDIEEVPGALWNRKLLSETRVNNNPDLVRIVVGVDPTGSTSNETGIVVAGRDLQGHGYVLDDRSLLGTPGEWAGEVITAYNRNDADMIVGEVNYGGDMVESNIMGAADATNQVCRYKNVRASRGKAVRAEPIVARYERGIIHHVGEFADLEDEMVSWVPGESRYSPNRVDALVWAFTELFLEQDLPIDSPLPSPSCGAGRFAP